MGRDPLTITGLINVAILITLLGVIIGGWGAW